MTARIGKELRYRTPIAMDINCLTHTDGTLRNGAVEALNSLRDVYKFNVWIWCDKPLNGAAPKGEAAFLNLKFGRALGTGFIATKPNNNLIGDIFESGQIPVTFGKYSYTKAFVLENGIRMDNRNTQDDWVELLQNLLESGASGVNFDFDGVIHRYIKKYPAIDKPNEDAITTIETLLGNSVKVNVLSTRPKVQIIEWFKEYYNDIYVNRLFTISNHRDVNYQLYTIDDRAIPSGGFFGQMPLGQQINYYIKNDSEALQKYNATLKVA